MQRPWATGEVPRRVWKLDCWAKVLVAWRGDKVRRTVRIGSPTAPATLARGTHAHYTFHWLLAVAAPPRYIKWIPSERPFTFPMRSQLLLK